MSSTFPSILTTYTDPQATDKLNAPSHSGIERNQNSGLQHVEAIIGTESLVAGTLIYDIRSPFSNGGGHVQTANKGGTGQTSFAKGDILIASSSSVLSKLSVGANNAVLQADSNQSSGVKWSNAVSPKVAVSASLVSLTNSTAETSIMSVVISGSTLGTSNALRARLFINNFNTDSVDESLILKGLYGTTSVATLVIGSVAGTQTANLRGVVELNILANQSASAQRGIMKADFAMNTSSSVFGVTRSRYASAAATEDSGADKVIGITARFPNSSSTNNDLDIDGYTVERIT